MSFEKIFEEYWQFSQKAFDTSPADSVFGLIREAHELYEALNYKFGKKEEITEMADVQFYLLYCLFRSGYSMGDFIEAMENKLDILKQRKWKQNPDNTYSHIKTICIRCGINPVYLDSDVCSNCITKQF